MKRMAKYQVVDKEIPAFLHKDGDAGFDMYTVNDTWIFPFKVKKIMFNFKGEIPENYFGLITSRSGESIKGNVLVPGIIDSTYRGIVHGLITRIGLFPRKIKRGTRIAQLIIIPYEEIKWISSDVLKETLRNDNGFGSTGVD